MDKSQSTYKCSGAQQFSSTPEGNPRKDSGISPSPLIMSTLHSSQNSVSPDRLDHQILLSCPPDHAPGLPKKSGRESYTSETRVVPRHETTDRELGILPENAESQHNNKTHARHSAPLYFVVPYAPPELLSLKNVSIELNSDSSENEPSLESETSSSESGGNPKVTVQSNPNQYPIRPGFGQNTKLQVQEVCGKASKIYGSSDFNTTKNWDDECPNMPVPTKTSNSQMLPGVLERKVIESNKMARDTITEPDLHQGVVRNDALLDNTESNLQSESFAGDSGGLAARTKHPLKTATRISKIQFHVNATKSLKVKRYDKVKTQFILHSERKGWMICKKCEQIIWAPNCSRHASLCKEKES